MTKSILDYSQIEYRWNGSMLAKLMTFTGAMRCTCFALVILVAGCASNHSKNSPIDKLESAAQDKNSTSSPGIALDIHASDTCSDPLVDQDGDKVLTQRDVFLRDYERSKRGQPVCVMHDQARNPQAALFDSNQTSLKPEVIDILDAAIKVLKQHPSLKIEIAGHADSVGSDSYNRRLSLRRARAGYNYLIKSGIDSSQLVGPIGYGETRPINSNATEEGRAQNRRIELNVQN